MDQATSHVCFADSDSEDYVSFDEQELNKGIADLYDDDSASDAASDASVPEINLDEIAINENIEIEPAQQMQQQQRQQEAPKAPQTNIIFNLFGGKKEKEKEEKKKKKKKGGKKKNVKQRKKRSSNKHSAPSSYAASSAFSARRRSSFNESDDSDSDDNEEEEMLYSSKQKVATKLNKRINRLMGMQEKAVLNRKHKKVIHRQKVNTNVISVDLGTLSTAAITTGESYKCKSCKSILSVYDKLLKSYDDIKLDDADDESIWICSFCNHINIIEIDEEEKPKNDTVDYILAPPDNDDDNKNNTASAEDKEEQIIFCIDISGSMCVTTAVDGKKGIKLKLKGNRLKEDEDALSQFIDPMNRNQWMPNQKQNVQYISRLQCVQSAVDEQITNISKTNPNYKIGLVTFNNDVTVIGDGMMDEHKIITGDKLKNLSLLKEIGENIKIDNKIGKSHEKLCDSLWNLKETGQTALGPALVVSIAMASSKAGSQVILCTDGLANIGVGSLDGANNDDNNNNDQIANDSDDEEDEDPVLKWYQALGDYAVSKGVIVNIISITDDGCKLENLGKLVEATNGNLKRINPLQLTSKFSGIIENQIIATNCQSTMLLHPGLKHFDTIKNVKVDESLEKQKKKENEKESVVNSTKEEKKNDDDDENKNDDVVDKNNEGRKIYKIDRSMQDVGNVFAETRIFFEYVVNKEKVRDFKLLKKLPFQVQICYQKKDGSKMLRVISQQRDVTFDKKEMRKNLNMDILAKYGTKVTTELCAKGDYESSRAWTSANTQFMNRNISYGNKKQLLTLASYANDNIVLDHQMHKQQITEQIEEQNECFNNNNNQIYKSSAAPSSSLSSSFSFKKKKSKKSKMKSRKGARNDQFSSYMYNMKKKSHK